jgi:hypothetical protein
MGSYDNKKSDCIAQLKATHGGSWDKLSKIDKFNIFKHHMELRKAIGQKTWENPYK